MSDRLRVVIAEDNYLVREGTRPLLEDSGEIEVLAAVGDAEQLRHAVRRLTPDAVLTDIRMPPGHHMEGIEAAHAIRAEHPGIGVAVLSQHTDESYAFALLRDGTTGLAYLLKDRLGDLEDLIRALREVARGGSVIDPHVVDALVARRTRTTSPSWPPSPSASSTSCARWPKAKPTPASNKRCTCQAQRSRNTSTRSSASSAWPTSRYTAAWRPC